MVWVSFYLLDQDEQLMKISAEKYKKDFGINPKDPRKLRAALNHALDIRKFEIELYWKRATYFWTLIASTFAAYFLILGAQNSPDKRFFAFVVSCVGLVFTFAWFQVNRGSKQWQENWENHVDILEDEVTGPLYKTMLRRPFSGDLFDRAVTEPKNISVSKTNQIVNLFTLCIWMVLAYFSVDVIDVSRPISVRHCLVGVLAIAFCLLILWKARTHSGDHCSIAVQRETNIN